MNAEGTRTVLDACLAAGVERVVHVSSVAAIGPARAGRRARRAPRASAGPLGIPYADAKHAAEVEALRVARARARRRHRYPAHVLGARRRAAVLDRGRAPLPAAPHPGLRRRRDQHRRRRRTSPPGCCCATSAARPASATSSAPATTRGSGCSPSSRASRASSRPPCGCPTRRRWRSPRPAPRLPGPPARDAGRGPRRGALVDVPLGQRAARARLDRRARTRRRSRRPSSGAMERLGDRVTARTRQPLAARAWRASPAARSATCADGCRRERDPATAAARRRTGCARAGASRASCAGAGSRSRSGACLARGATATRSTR